MVKEFKVGNHYRLRQDYPDVTSAEQAGYIVYNGRKTVWCSQKLPLLKDRDTWARCNNASPSCSLEGAYIVEFYDVSGGAWNYYSEDFDELETYNDTNNESCSENSIKNGGSKMELKEVKKINAKEALKQYNEEKANEEIEFAKKELRRLNDNINRCDRDIQKLQDEKKTYTDKLSELKV